MVEKKKPTAPEAVSKALDEFLSLNQDVSTVHQVEQRLELHISGTNAYIPSYTRQVMDKANGAPIQALFTKTHKESKKVFLYVADDVNHKGARKLRADETLGPAFFAFGVPLRTLQLKLPVSRRIVVPLNQLEVPDRGTVWWASFAEIERESRNIDKEAAAARQAKAQARKSRKKAPAAQPEPQPGAQ